jgi:CheY-like chemotaxis protein
MRNVLVIEDDDDLREVVTETLQRAGFHCVGACDGDEALGFLAREHEPYLIILDLMMPRMSGWEFRRRQLADPRLARFPVVVMTATETLEQAAIHADGLLRKPLSLNALLTMVKRFARPDARRRPDDVRARQA